LHALLSADLQFHDFVTDLRGALAKIVTTLRPQWAKRVFLGRARFLTEMDRIDREVRQCFLACTRFRRHRVRCFHGTGGESWRDEDLRGNSSLRRCG
jgi:hypothetical protein